MASVNLLEVTLPQSDEPARAKPFPEKHRLISSDAGCSGAAPLSSSNFIPLYWAGLCEAVMTTPPPQMCSLTIMPTPAVVTIPRSITSIPTPHNPAVTAEFNIWPLGRESLPMHTESFCFLPALLFFRKVPKALPYSAATEAVRVSPTMPLTPLTLIISCSAIPKTPFGHCLTRYEHRVSSIKHRYSVQLAGINLIHKIKFPDFFNDFCTGLLIETDG